MLSASPGARGMGGLIEAAGRSLVVGDIGEGPALLHGGLSDIEDSFGALRPYLTGRRLLAFEQVGHGRSAWDGRAFAANNMAGLLPGWPGIVSRNPALWSLPGWDIADFGGGTAPVLVMQGDRDMVRPEHAVAMARALPASQLAILPVTDHSGPQRRPEAVAALLARFFG